MVHRRFQVHVRIKGSPLRLETTSSIFPGPKQVDEELVQGGRLAVVLGRFFRWVIRIKMVVHGGEMLEHDVQGFLHAPKEFGPVLVAGVQEEVAHPELRVRIMREK